MGRRKSIFLLGDSDYTYITGCTVYTNSLLATLNARDLIRKSADTVNYSTADNKVNVSLREFPKNESVTPRVELPNFHILSFYDLRQFMQQAANISIKINTTKDYVTDSISERDMDKTVVCSIQVSCLGTNY